MAARIRMKRLGRSRRPFYRICAVDPRNPRDGKVIEELGTYDPMVRETDARAVFNEPRMQYWLSVGAQPSDAIRVLWKKYGLEGTHRAQMEAARARLAAPREVPPTPEPVAKSARRKKGEAEAIADAPAAVEAEAAPPAEAPAE